MGRPELPLAFAMLLFGPSLLALGAGLVFVLRARAATVHVASAWPAEGAALDYAPPPPLAKSGRMGRFLLLVACAVPTALFALCGVALLDGRLSLGHWPRPIADAVSPLAQASFLVSMVYLLLQFLIVPAAILAAVLIRRNRLAAVSLLVYGAASLATLGFVWFSPLGPWVIGD